MVIAARDEAARVGETIAAIRRALPHAAVTVADDGSRDPTKEIASALRARVMRAQRPRGKGQAVSEAAGWALERLRASSGEGLCAGEVSCSGEDPCCGEGVVLLCDGDLGDCASELGALVGLVARGETELALGAFEVARGGGFGLAIGFARWAVRRRCGRSLRAPLSGQRALSAGALELLLPFAAGYGMELGMTIDALRAGLRVRELALPLSHRARGRTPAGFVHRGRQLLDIISAARARA